MTARRISVIVAGADAVSRGALVEALEADGDIAVAAQVTPGQAPRAVRTLHADLLTVDLPGTPAGREEALAMIDEVMAYAPVPILVLHRSPDADGGEAVEAAAIAAGALACMARPPAWHHADGHRLRGRVRALCGVPVIRHVRGRLTTAPGRGGIPVVGMAASTGGPPALARVLGGLAGLPAAVLVVQHIDRRFVGSFVEFLRRASALPVEVAVHGMPLREGRVHVAPADLHLSLAAIRCASLSAAPELLHRPSADILFRSLAVHAGNAAVGVVLTGMGDDGASGLLTLRERGGSIIGQDAASCAVFGMPRAAQMLGAVDRLTTLADIAGAVRSAVAGMRS
jgi:two-component system, chemotaxis family, protein-glutamate methylesterase/glutaminase